MAWNDQSSCHFPSYELHRCHQVCSFEEEGDVHGSPQQNAVPLSSHCTSIPSPKVKFTDVFYRNGHNAMLLQSLSSPDALQLEQTPDVPQFYSPLIDTFPDSVLLASMQQPQSGELPSLFSANCYLPPLERPTPQAPFQQNVEQLIQVTTIPDAVSTLATTSWSPQQPTTDEPTLTQDRRKLCCVSGCTNQARNFGRCKRHGGSKRCSSPGCTKSVQTRGLCIRHGGGGRCQETGCDRASQSYGKCKMHGGGRPCIVEGCEKKAHLKRLCRKHGGGTKCRIFCCEKWAQRQGMCTTHANTNDIQAANEI